MIGAAHDAHDSPSRTGNWLLRHGKWLIIGPPMLYLLVFFLIPFAFALKISFADTAVRVPPFTDILTIDPDWHIHLTLSLSNFQYLFTDEIYGVSYLYSIRTAFFSTLVCLALGYPMAYAIASTSKSTQSMLLLVIILPFWTSFLLRVYALEGIIRETGLLNSALHLAGHHPPAAADHAHRRSPSISASSIRTCRSWCCRCSPPSRSSIIRCNEAAADLGSPPWRTFLDVTLPLSVPGIIAGSMLVFIPAVGEFVIPTLLGGPDNLMIGRVLWDEFFGNRDWPVASAVAVAFLILLVGPIALYQHYSTKQLEA